MLKRFAVKNFRGFREELVWDLSQAGNYQFNTHAVRDGIIKNGVIYGTNGSGKSNLGMAIMDIVQHLDQYQKVGSYYDNYIYAATEEGAVVDFSYTFQFGDKELVYRYSKDKSGVLQEEELYVNGVLDFAQYQDRAVEFGGYRIDEEVQRDVMHSRHRISLVLFLSNSLPLGKSHHLNQLKYFAECMLYCNTVGNQGKLNTTEMATKVDSLLIGDNLIDDYRQFLWDMTGQEIVFDTPKEGEDDLYCLVDNHRVLWRKIASEGTKALTLQFVQVHVATSDNVLFAFFDEFDAFYHHDLAYLVCRWMFEKKPIQVFMTTHHTSIMTNDLLRPDCYFVIDGKAIKPINKMTKQELRQAHNLEKMYRGKAFSL